MVWIHACFGITFTIVKPVAYTMMLLMLFFTAQPLLVVCQQQPPVVKSEPESCCKSKSPVQEQDKNCAPKDCNRTTSCNPFAGCSQCHYLANETGSNLLNISSRKTRIPTQNDRTIAGFISESWNPPEFVFPA